MRSLKPRRCSGPPLPCRCGPNSPPAAGSSGSHDDFAEALGTTATAGLDRALDAGLRLR